MPDIIDRFNAKLREHRDEGMPEAVALHVSPELWKEAGLLIDKLPAAERALRRVTFDRDHKDQAQVMTLGGLPVVPHDIPRDTIWVLGDSPMTRTLLGLAETDNNPRRRAQREAFVVNNVLRGKDRRRLR